MRVGGTRASMDLFLAGAPALALLFHRWRPRRRRRSYHGRASLASLISSIGK